MTNKSKNTDLTEDERLWLLRPLWVQKKELREVSFMRKMIFHLYHVLMMIKANHLQNRINKIGLKVKKQEKKYFYISKKILYPNGNLERENNG